MSHATEENLLVLSWDLDGHLIALGMRQAIEYIKGNSINVEALNKTLKDLGVDIKFNTAEEISRGEVHPSLKDFVDHWWHQKPPTSTPIGHIPYTKDELETLHLKLIQATVALAKHFNSNHVILQSGSNRQSNAIDSNLKAVHPYPGQYLLELMRSLVEESFMRESISIPITLDPSRLQDVLFEPISNELLRETIGSLLDAEISRLEACPPEELISASCMKTTKDFIDNILRPLKLELSKPDKKFDSEEMARLMHRIFPSKPLCEALLQLFNKIETDDGRLPNICFSPLKIRLLYWRMHKIALEHPDKHCDFVFSDDRADILCALNIFFERNPDFIPKNMTLHLQQYNPFCKAAGPPDPATIINRLLIGTMTGLISPPILFPPIPGTGETNLNLMETMRNLSKAVIEMERSLYGCIHPAHNMGWADQSKHDALAALNYKEYADLLRKEVSRPLPKRSLEEDESDPSPPLKQGGGAAGGGGAYSFYPSDTNAVEDPLVTSHDKA